MHRYEELVAVHGEDLVAAQAELEAEMIDGGGQRQRNAVSKARQGGREADTGYGTALTRHAVAPVAEGIEEFLTIAFDKGRPSRRATSAKLMRDADPSVLAFIAIRTMIDGVSSAVGLTTMGVRIGNRLEDEARFRALREKAPALARWTKRKAGAATASRVRSADHQLPGEGRGGHNDRPEVDRAGVAGRRAEAGRDRDHQDRPVRDHHVGQREGSQDQEDAGRVPRDPPVERMGQREETIMESRRHELRSAMIADHNDSPLLSIDRLAMGMTLEKARSLGPSISGNNSSGNFLGMRHFRH